MDIAIDADADAAVEISPLAVSAYIMPGDDIAVRSPGPTGALIRRALSRGQEVCWSNHNSQVFKSPIDNRLYVLHVRSPRSTITPLADYLPSLRNGGYQWVVTRRAWINNASQGIVDTYRREYSATIWASRLNDYSETSIAKLAWNILTNPLRARFPYMTMMRPAKAAFWCTKLTVDAERNCGPGFECDSTRHILYPTPLHRERSWRDGDLVLVRGGESLPGTFDKVVTAYGG